MFLIEFDDSAFCCDPAFQFSKSRPSKDLIVSFSVRVLLGPISPTLDAQLRF